MATLTPSCCIAVPASFDYSNPLSGIHIRSGNIGALIAEIKAA
jgi:hypothetical protein